MLITALAKVRVTVLFAALTTTEEGLTAVPLFTVTEKSVVAGVMVEKPTPASVYDRTKLAPLTVAVDKVGATVSKVKVKLALAVLPEVSVSVTTTVWLP